MVLYVLADKDGNLLCSSRKGDLMSTDKDVDRIRTHRRKADAVNTLRSLRAVCNNKYWEEYWKTQSYNPNDLEVVAIDLVANICKEE